MNYELFGSMEPILDENHNIVLQAGNSQWSFVGQVAQVKVELERLDIKRRSEDWKRTDTIYPGERYRVRFSNNLHRDCKSRYWRERTQHIRTEFAIVISFFFGIMLGMILWK